MDITDKDLKEWSASDEFKLWFARRFGEWCDYQVLLDRLAEEDMPEEANWLMNHAGQDRKAVLNIDCVSKDKKHVFAAGDLVIEKGIFVDGWLRAGGNINAGEEIYAGLGIVSGEEIVAKIRIHCTNGSINAKYSILCGGYVNSAGDIQSGLDIISERSIYSKRNIMAGGAIRSEREISAGGSISADMSISSGLGIEAGELISAGPGFCVLAGMSTPVEHWGFAARVIAKEKPANLMSGHWVEPTPGAFIEAILASRAKEQK